MFGTRILLLFAVLTTAFLSNTPLASAQAENGQITDQQLEELVGTLEDEGQRKEFIDNLKTLIESRSILDEENRDAPMDALDVSQAIGFDKIALATKDSYLQLLSQLGLSENVGGKILISLFWIGVWLLFRWGWVRFIGFIERKLVELKTHFQLMHRRFEMYCKFTQRVGKVLITLLIFYILLTVWGTGISNIITQGMIMSALDVLVNIFIVSLLALGSWEVLNTVLETRMNRADPEQEARLRTLLPLIRNILFIVVIVLLGFVVLSELGIDIMPLMAGAGVLGIAIGFGAQTLVKDFLTGFLIILEDLIQVGDVASVGGHTGLVERITIRKVQLRDLSGVVHTVPFSEITTIENLTKDFSFYAMDIGVAYRENTDEVIKYLREVDEELRNDEEYGVFILEPLEVLGVDSFADSAVIIKARIKTRPIKQWMVGREFNRRMKMKFDEKGIEIPFPHQTIFFGVDKENMAPPAHIMLENIEKIEADSKEAKKKKEDKKDKS